METQENVDVQTPNTIIKKEICEDDYLKDTVSEIRMKDTSTENKEIQNIEEAFCKYCKEIDGIPHCSICNDVRFKDLSEILDHMKSHITEKKTSLSVQHRWTDGHFTAESLKTVYHSSFTAAQLD